MQKLRKKSPSTHHRTTLLCCIFPSKACICIDNRKKIVKHQYLFSSTCPDNSELRPLAAETDRGNPANFNGFCVLASLLQRRHSLEANQTLRDVWPSPGLVHYVFIFGGSYPLTVFCYVQNSLCVQVLRSPILSALLHGTRVVGFSQTMRH